MHKRLPMIRQALNARARADYTHARLRATIVDPGTGNVRPTIVKTMRRILEKQAGWKKTLAGLRSGD